MEHLVGKVGLLHPTEVVLFLCWSFHLLHRQWRILASSLCADVPALARSPLSLKSVLFPFHMPSYSSLTSLTKDLRWSFSPFQQLEDPVTCGWVFAPSVNTVGVICCPNVDQIHFPHPSHWNSSLRKSRFTLVPLGHCRLRAMLLLRCKPQRWRAWHSIWNAFLPTLTI